MANTYYDDLGIKPDATKSEIKSAYRKLVLLHHPDRSKDPRSKAIFLRIREANEVLADPEQRRLYDAKLELIARRLREDAEKRAAEEKRKIDAQRKQEERTTTPSGATVAEEVLRLQSLYGSGRHSEAEKLAHAILQVDPRQAIPYAVIADILRARGYMNEAGKMYAYAAQMDPSNPVYQRRYEQLLSSSRVVTKNGTYKIEAVEQNYKAPTIGAAFVVGCGLVVMFSPEHIGIVGLPMVSSWTLGLIFMLFLSGVCLGASLAVGNLLDRFGLIASSATGRSSPTAILGLVAVVNFWVSALLYVMIAIGLRAFNYSTTRLMMGVGAATLFMAAACLPSKVLIPSQTLLWGGNLIYIGGLVGWMAVDSMRGAE